jgi:ABC-2 type transport system ATP-binding protein
LLEMVGLGQTRTRTVGEFSKGMQRRIGLAQALINDPDLVILDEPMSGLDPIGRREVRDIILDLRARGRTVFFSTHILSDTEMICDRVGILVRGSLKAVGTVEELVRGEARFWEVTLAGVNGGDIPCGRIVSRGADQVLVRVETQADLHRLLGAFNGNGARIVSVTPARQSLEDLLVREVRRAVSAGAGEAGHDAL